MAEYKPVFFVLAFFLACLVSLCYCLPEYCGKDADADYEPKTIPKVDGYELKQVQVAIR
jgi:hypothetical protein